MEILDCLDMLAVVEKQEMMASMEPQETKDPLVYQVLLELPVQEEYQDHRVELEAQEDKE